MFCCRCLFKGFLFAMLFVFVVNSQLRAQDKKADISPEQRQAKLSEREHLWQQATELDQQNKLAEAIAVVRRSLEIETELFGATHEQVATSLAWIAQRYETLEDFGQAIAVRREVRQMRAELDGNDHWKVTDARLAIENDIQLQQLTGVQRATLRQATLDDARVSQLYRDGQYAEAIRIAESNLKTRSELQSKFHPESIDCLNNLSLLHQETGEYARALQLALEVKSLSEQSLGKAHPDYAASLNNLALLYQETGDYENAQSAFLEATSILEHVLGEDHPDYASALNNLADLHLLKSDYASAEPLYLKAKRIREKSLGEEHPDYASSLNSLASLYESTGDYSRAEPLYLRAKALREKVLGKEHPRYATTLNNLALLYESMGDDARAESLYLETIAIDEKSLGKEHPHYAQSLNNLASLYRSMGDYARAEPLYLQAKAIRQKVLGKEHPDYAASLNNLAVLYESMSDYVRAEPLYLEANAIFLQLLGKNHPDYATNLNNLAALYQAMGDYTRAEPLYLQTKAIREATLGKEHPDYAACLNNLAELYRLMGDLDRAEPLYLQAKAIREKVLGILHPDYAVSLNNLALLYHTMGSQDRAKTFYLEARAIQEVMLGKEHPDYATTLNNLAFVYASAGDYANAEALCLEACAIREKVLGQDHPDYASVLNNLAFLYHRTGEFTKAERLYLEALQITRTHLELTSLIQSERAQLVAALSMRHQLDSMFSLAIESGKFNEQAFDQLLSWKGATLVRQMQMRKLAREEQFAPLLEELQKSAMRLATLSRLAPKPDQRDAWEQQLNSARAEKERLEQKLSLASSEFRQSLQLVTLKSLLDILPKECVLLDFLEYDRMAPAGKGDDNTESWQKSLLAFVVRSNSPVELIDLGPVAVVNEQIDLWRRGFGSTAESKKAGAELRASVWVPIEKHLGDRKLVLLSPDGALGQLPFAALPGRESGRYLIEEYRLAMIPVPQLLVGLMNRDQRRELSGGLLIMGDVDYDAEPQLQVAGSSNQPQGWQRSNVSEVRGDMSFGPLSETPGEIARIQDLFRELFDPSPDQIHVLKKTTATEAAFREHAPKYYNLHLATHGFFADPTKQSISNIGQESRELQRLSAEHDEAIGGFDPGLLSGLAFSGANQRPETDRDDGILTAEEIASLSLDGVDLVVLSACETGLGSVAGGEGLIGIQRAFQVAGARTTIASLWKVDDLATRRLMERFYRNYWEKKMSKLDALHESQLYLLNNSDAIRGDARRRPVDDKIEPQRLSPEFWAAFTLSGDWR